MFKVCLDPGHGGYDPGAVGNGLREKDITLGICLELKTLLEFNGISVVMTRDGDYAPGNFERDTNKELQARVDIANQNEVDLFASVHVNAGGGTGVEVLVSGMGGRAELAANKVLRWLDAIGDWPNRGVKAQNVLVLRRTSMPAILTENGFIDSVSDSNALKNQSFKHLLAVAHAKGICEHFGMVYEPLIVTPPSPPVVADPDPDMYLTVRCRISKADQAIIDINKLGFACKRLDLA